MTNFSDQMARSVKWAQGTLLGSIDVVALAHIISVYLLDNNVLKLIIGFVLQLAYLSPFLWRIPTLRPRRRRPVIFAIVANYIYGALVPLFFADPPTVGADGLLHGVLLTEFTGCLPGSPPRLAALATVILFLQLCSFSMIFDLSEPRETAADAENEAAAINVGDEENRYTLPPVPLVDVNAGTEMDISCFAWNPAECRIDIWRALRDNWNYNAPEVRAPPVEPNIDWGVPVPI